MSRAFQNWKMCNDLGYCSGMGDTEVETGVRTFPPPPPENHKLLYVPLKILVRTPLEKQSDPSGPIAYRERSVRPSVKYVGDSNKKMSGSPW